MATGVPDAVVIDTLLGLGVNVDRLMSMSREDRVIAIIDAEAAGRLTPKQTAFLRELGVLPPSN